MKQTNVEMAFSGKKVTEIVGISYRQLDYWTRTELISPSIEKGEGSGSRRRYSYKDLLELRVCLLYTSPSPRDAHESRMPSSA